MTLAEAPPAVRRLHALFLAVALAGCSGSEAPPAPQPDDTTTPAPTGTVDTVDTAGTSTDPCGGALPVLTSPPDTLSQTGLYASIDPETLAPGVRHFTPAGPLWTDGAVKSRWVYLPPCTQIDTSDMDHWDFPVGSRFWKEFVRDGVRVETRFVHRYGPGPDDWLFAAYVWRDSQREADLELFGVENASGTKHDVPALVECLNCHKSSRSRVLGFDAFQLSHPDAGFTIDELGEAGWLTDPAPPGGYVIPGDAVAKAALGYMHANCGTCHNPDGLDYVDMDLRLSVHATTVEQTPAFQTAVNVSTTNFVCFCDRIEPGLPLLSAIHIRMSNRGTPIQMPPVGTEQVDDAGLAAVRAWIESL